MLKKQNKPVQNSSGNLAETTLANTREAMSSNLTPANQTLKKIDNVFLRFSAIYGHVWQSQYRDKDYIQFAKKEWANVLKSFDTEIINQTIDFCIKQIDLPPTLAQFYRLCKQTLSAKHEHPQLENTLVNSALAKEYLKQIKNILKGQSV